MTSRWGRSFAIQQERNVPSCQVARHSFKSVPNEWRKSVPCDYSFKNVPDDYSCFGSCPRVRAVLYSWTFSASERLTRLMERVCSSATTR